MLEKDLEIYDIWESPNENLFIKISDDYSIGIGKKGHHEPNEEWGELKRSQYIKSNEITPVKKVGRMIFDDMKYDEKRTLLLAYEEYCHKMKKLYEHPRPKALLIDAFLNER